MDITRETIGLAGEFAVASELCRRGVYCQLTLGNRKKTDLLVDTEEKLFRISVKTKQKQSWPAVKGIWQENDLLIFVDYKNKKVTERPDFYVLNVESWKKVVKKKLKKDQKKEVPSARIDEENTLVFEWIENGKKKKWVGCAVSVNEVELFKDAWPEFDV